VRNGEVAARGHGVEQASHDAVGVVFVADEVEDADQDDADRLGEVQGRRGARQDRLGVA
jgi:hypothetical protein